MIIKRLGTRRTGHMQRLIEEAQARKLDRIAIAYAVAGWVLVQGASIVFPTFDAPVWTLRVFIVAVILGFPAALTIAWFVAPHTESADTTPGGVSHREVVLLALLGVVLLLALGELGIVIWLTPPSPVSAANRPAEGSIAVLAFNNMSDDPKNEYFSDGISEELLNDLAQVPGLRVAGRTSSFSFKGKSKTIEDIGKALNVRTVLEGSVRREGNRVRITAQLINAADDFHIWSQSYDRELADIFAVQDEIARAITRELTGRLLGKPAVAKPQINPEAYTAYLQGRFFLNKRNKPDMERAIDFFKQAIQLEPNYADAHASLGRTYALLYSNGQSRDTLQNAKDEAAAALKLDPDNFQALVTKGIIAYSSLNWQEAATTLRRATKLNPNDADAQHFYSQVLNMVGLPEAAFGPGRHAAALDPLKPVMRASLGDFYIHLNRNAEAAVEYQAALTLDPNFVIPLADLCQVDADMGKLDEAKKILTDRLIAVDGEDGPNTNNCRAFIASRSGNWPELNRLTTIALRHYASGEMTASDVGWVYALAGNVDQAMHWYEKAYDERELTLFFDVSNPDLPAQLKVSPRFKAFMQRPLIKEWQAAHDRVAAELAAGK